MIRFVPKIYPGAQDRAFLEFQKWVVDLTRGFDSRIDDVETQLAMQPDMFGEIKRLREEIIGLKTMIATMPDLFGLIERVERQIKDISTSIAMEK